MNNNNLEVKIRQASGLSLKGLLERSFDQINEETLDFFKENILKCYSDESEIVRKTVTNLINTFISQGEIAVWPEILDFLESSLNNDKYAEMSLETLMIIIEDSGIYLEENHTDVLIQTFLLTFLTFNLTYSLFLAYLIN